MSLLSGVRLCYSLFGGAADHPEGVWPPPRGCVAPGSPTQRVCGPHPEGVWPRGAPPRGGVAPTQRVCGPGEPHRQLLRCSARPDVYLGAHPLSPNPGWAPLGPPHNTRTRLDLVQTSCPAGRCMDHGSDTTVRKAQAKTYGCLSKNAYILIFQYFNGVLLPNFCVVLYIAI